MIRLDVVGIPAPQGSKVKMPNGAMLDGTSGKARASLVEWRRAVADAARDYKAENPGPPLTGAVQLLILFRFAPTKSDPYRHLHVTYPDVSKLARSTEDALVSGGLLSDDRIICNLSVRKRYCDDDQSPGAVIEVSSLAVVEAKAREARKQRAADARRRPRPDQPTLAGVAP